jgi:hypothetical protein
MTTVDELANVLTKYCEKKIAASLHPGMASPAYSESNLHSFLESARNESEFLSGINSSSDSIEKRMQRSEMMVRAQCEAVVEHLRAIRTREIDAALRSLDSLHQLSETKLMRVIDSYDKDIDKSISKLSYKGNIDIYICFPSALRLKLNVSVYIYIYNAVKQSHDESRKLADSSVFLEQSMDLYYRKLKINYDKALKRTQRRFEVNIYTLVYRFDIFRFGTSFGIILSFMTGDVSWP